jgi:NAD(P)-dependent dehydrogenase (short-subunit alcohol dehydrogenase family)
MPTYLVSGGNRGLGLEFVRQYAAEGARLIVGVRAPERAEALNALAAAHPGQVAVHPLDVADAGSVAGFRRAVGDAPIDALIANAGVMPAGQQFGAIDYEQWLEALKINTLGPVRLAEAFVDNVRRGGERKMLALTSMLGSVGANTGGYLTYRATKAALNSAWKTLSIALRPEGITCVLLHPGHARTDMGGPGAAVDPVESIAGLRQVIAGLAPADTGRFITWQGQDYPW